MKKNVLISFITEADSDLQAVFNLQKVIFKLSDEDIVKFDAFDVVDVLCNCEMVCYCGEKELVR